MTMFKGRSAHIGLALERDGEAATTPEYSVPRTESTVKDTIEQIQNDSAVGNIAHYNDQITVGVHGEGDITTKLWHRGLYYFLVGIFGKLPEKVENEDGSFTYKFTMANNNNHMGMTIFSKDPNVTCKYPSAMVNEATIEWSPTEFAKLTASLISKRSVKIDESSVIPAYSNDGEFKPHQLELKIADTVEGLKTAQKVTLFRSASLTITKNVEGEQTSDSGLDYGAMMNGDLEASISLEKFYVDEVYRDMVLNDTKKAVSFGFVDSENKAGTAHDTVLRFIFPKVGMTSYETAMGVSETATESFEGTAMLDLNSGDLVTAEWTTKNDYSQA